MADIWECTNKEYHGDTSRIGATMLKVALKSPATYFGMYVAKNKDGTPVIAHKQSKDLLLGSLVHCLVLERSQFDSLYCVRPKVDGRTTKGKEVLAKWATESLGKQEVEAELIDQARAMADSVLRHPIIQEILAGPHILERAIIWRDHGVEQKCRADIFVPRPDMPSDCHLDIKTTDDPTPEHWQSFSSFAPMHKWRYDMQVAAHYPTGIEALTGRPCASAVIAVSKSEPYDVYIHDTTSHRKCGEAWRERALRILEKCQQTGVWQRDDEAFVTALFPPPEYCFPPLE